ncbi:hypothetical protein ACFV0T_26430 [Streptomyces sp. NPDC059582]|uniref:hypothetical protein n=1 Tax=Streptomyces sp. NPDC059582 TaxID=3346875 RepID=UPI0036C318BE
MTATPETDETETVQTPDELLADLGELHMRTLVSPRPKQPAAMGWQAVAGTMSAGFARALHALNELNPAKAAEITDWYQGPFEEGPDAEEHTDWLERTVAKGDLDLMEKWVQDGQILARSSKEAVEAHEAAEQEPMRLILSKALGLGTGAPWDTIQHRANELAALADEEQPAEGDTLPAWLRQRFTASGVDWENLDDAERSYWEHQARAVRRAVARGGFKGGGE